MTEGDFELGGPVGVAYPAEGDGLAVTPASSSFLSSWAVEDDWKVRVMFSLARTVKVSSPLFDASQAHDAAVTKVAWAHPEFGTILASSSFDRTVKVWEQTSYSDSDLQANGTSGPSQTSRWVERTSLIDAKGTVRAVEFAPHQFGLKLVSACASLVPDTGFLMSQIVVAHTR